MLRNTELQKQKRSRSEAEAKQAGDCRLAYQREQGALAKLADRPRATRSYPIVFEPLSALGDQLAKLRKVGRCVVVSNDIVGPLYAEKVLASLERAGWKPEYVELRDGEENKTAETYLGLVNKLLDLQVDRKTPVIAVGGGVTTDIVGFAAATTLRGLPFANVPTTLLAQVDASVGGKTGVNTTHGKNLLGAFWQPFLVHVAVETLASLSDAEFRCGLGEVIKHAVLEETPDPSDAAKLVPSTEFMEWLEANSGPLTKREPQALSHTIRRCCEIKAGVVSADETESGKRALLNLGHTVGHAIEAVVGFGGLRHGEAVAMGTIAETQLAVIRGACSDSGLPDRIANLTRALGLPTGLADLDLDALETASYADKKREDAVISVTLPFAIGDVRLVKIAPSDLRPAFERLSLNAVACSPSKSDQATFQGAAQKPLSQQPPAPAPPSSSSNSFASNSNPNSGNFVVDGRTTTRVRQPPGGASSITFG